MSADNLEWRKRLTRLAFKLSVEHLSQDEVEECLSLLIDVVLNLTNQEDDFEY